VVMALAFVLVTLQATPAARSHATLRDSRIAQCPKPPSTARGLSQDSIYHFSLESSLSQLKSLCPGARDTVIVGRLPTGEAEQFAGLVFAFDSLTAIGYQLSEVLESDRPADGWIVSGTLGSLPRGVHLTTSWRHLSQSYGNLQMQVADELVVRFCSLPRILFTIRLDSRYLSVLASSGDPARIPQGATIDHILILSRLWQNLLPPCSGK
jgi:hypothetical protein